MRAEQKSMTELEEERAHHVQQVKRATLAMNQHPDVLRRRLPAQPWIDLAAYWIDSGRLTALVERLAPRQDGTDETHLWWCEFTLDGRSHRWMADRDSTADWIEISKDGTLEQWYWHLDDQLVDVRALVDHARGGVLLWSNARATLAHRASTLPSADHLKQEHLLDAHILATLLYYHTWEYDVEALQEHEMLPLSDLFLPPSSSSSSTV